VVTNQARAPNLAQAKSQESQENQEDQESQESQESKLVAIS